MVGRRGVQVAALQAAPQHGLVLARAEGRAHHVGGGARKVGVAVGALVDHEVAGQHFAVHALAACAGAGDGVERFTARHVHHIDRHAQHVGDGNGAVGRLGLDHRRA
ncbi:hypothetical protein FQZ97_842740 [compost metagenome]